MVQLLERDRADLGGLGQLGVRTRGVGGGADRCRADALAVSFGRL